jgi:hypothetical protein
LATPTNGDTDKLERVAMRNFSKLAIVGTIGLVGIGAWTLPAAAATLAVQFTGTPTATTNTAPAGEGYGYNLFDSNTSFTVTGLGEFVNGSLSNVSTQGNQGTGSTPGDWVYVGSGSTIPTSESAIQSSALFSVELYNTLAIVGPPAVPSISDVTLVGTYWAFASITPEVLASGNYWIAVLYGDANTAQISTSAVTTEAGISLTGGATCTQSTSCSNTGDVETFGPNLETAATPLPATLPLFAGGLGMLGLLGGRLRKRKASAATATA